MTMREIPGKFLVAFSFAGEQRELVRSVAQAVEQRLGSGTVFFDEWFEFFIAGPDSDTRLQEIYSQKAELVVVCVSASYGGKPWTLAEHEAIRGVMMKFRASQNEKDAFRVLPLRVGDGDVRGIPFNAICPDARKRPITDTADLILNRLRLIRPDATHGTEAAAHDSARFVYLAECTPDLDDPSKPINRERVKDFVAELGWNVLPSAEYPAEQYQSRLEQDLRQCQAFIQLLGPYPWKRGAYDRLQNDAAVELGIARFRYRSSEIDLKNVEATHREFICASEVMSTSFDDFLVDLKSKLTTLAHRADSMSLGGADGGRPPLVRVAIRSANPDVLWEQVFQWIYVHEKILSDQLAAGESFEAKHPGEPCHGFVVVCDAGALEDGPLSPREHMEQCRLIQLKEKNAARRPPVALVYWPPPAASWARLLRSTPLKLFCVSADAPGLANVRNPLSEFFAEVRKVAQ